MRPPLFFAVVATLVTIASSLCAQEYTIDVESNGDRIAVVNLLIAEDEATATVGDVIEHFDLKDQCWQYTDSKEWVSRSQCETWAQQSKEKSINSTASISERIRPFGLWSLDPTFRVEATDRTLKLTSGQVDYIITAKTTERDLTGIFRYARLNAYMKAMSERKLPPFAGLKVLEEMEHRKMRPESIVVRIPGVAGSPVSSLTCKEDRN